MFIALREQGGLSYDGYYQKIISEGVPVLDTDTGVIDYCSPLLCCKHVVNVVREKDGITYCVINKSFVCRELDLGYDNSRDIMYYRGWAYQLGHKLCTFNMWQYTYMKVYLNVCTRLLDDGRVVLVYRDGLVGRTKSYGTACDLYTFMRGAVM